MQQLPQWYVIQSKPRQEQVANEQLNRQGYKHLPTPSKNPQANARQVVERYRATVPALSVCTADPIRRRLQPDPVDYRRFTDGKIRRSTGHNSARNSG